MNQIYAHVINNEIKALNIRRGSSFKGKKLGAKSSDETYASMNLFPIVGAAPEYNSKTHTVSGPQYTWDSDTKLVTKDYTLSEISLEIQKQNKLKELHEYRKKIEFGGFTLPNGTFINTDKEDQRKIDGAVLGCQNNPDVIINFKTSVGYAQFDSVTMISIGQAVFNHIQACHTREMELTTAIDNDINTDITTGWPV